MLLISSETRIIYARFGNHSRIMWKKYGFKFKLNNDSKYLALSLCNLMKKTSVVSIVVFDIFPDLKDNGQIIASFVSWWQTCLCDENTFLEAKGFILFVTKFHRPNNFFPYNIVVNRYSRMITIIQRFLRVRLRGCLRMRVLTKNTPSNALKPKGITRVFPISFQSECFSPRVEKIFSP